jgi:hypothetical protein
LPFAARHVQIKANLRKTDRGDFWKLKGFAVPLNMVLSSNTNRAMTV